MKMKAILGKHQISISGISYNVDIKSADGWPEMGKLTYLMHIQSKGFDYAVDFDGYEATRDGQILPDEDYMLDLELAVITKVLKKVGHSDKEVEKFLNLEGLYLKNGVLKPF